MEGRPTVAFRGATWAPVPTFSSQHTPQPQLQQQPQQHAPLYNDPLSAPSDAWTTQKSQANLPPSSLFVNHAAPLSSFSGFAAQTPRKQHTTSSSPSIAAATGTNTHASFEEHVQSSLQGLFGRRSCGGAVGPWQPQKGRELGHAFGVSLPGSRRSTMAARPPPLLPDVPQAPKKKYPPPRPNTHNALSSSSSASRYAPEFPATAAGSAVAQSEEDPNYHPHPTIQRLERTSIFHDLLLLEDEEEGRETRHDVPLFPMDDDLHTAAAEEEAEQSSGRGGPHVVTSSRFAQLPVMTHGETKLQWSTTTATSSSSSSSTADGQRWRAEADDDNDREVEEEEEDVSSSRSIATTARPGSESGPENGPQNVQGGGIARGGGLVHALQTFHEQSLSSSSWAANMMMGHPLASAHVAGAEEDVPPSPFALLQHRGSAAEVAAASTPTAQLMHGAYAREWLQLVAQSQPSQSSLPDSTSRFHSGADGGDAAAARDSVVVHPHSTAAADDLLCDEGGDPDRGDTDSLGSHSTVAHRRSAHRNLHQEGGALPPQQQRARRGGAACAKRQRDLDSDADDLDTSLLVDEAEETLESCIAEQSGLRLHPSRRNPHAAPSSAAPRSPTRGGCSGGGSKYPTQHVPTQERLAVARQRFEQGWSSSWMPGGGGGEGSLVERPSHRFAPARRVEGAAQLQCSSGLGASSENEKDGRLTSLRVNNLTWTFPESKRGMFSTTTTTIAAPRGAAGGEASVGTVRGTTTDGRLEAWLRDVPLPQPRDAQ